MAPIQMKEIVIFSSEDSRYPAQNILKGQKWMTNSDDTTGKAVLEIQLDKASQIHYIDVGYCNVASLEVTVGRSSWPSSRKHVVLLATVILQTPTDARAGRNKTGCRMFNFLAHLNSEYSNEKWDRVRINLNQPFVRNKQMGLEFIRFGSPRNSTQTNGKGNTEISGNMDSWKNSSIAKLAGFNSNSSPKTTNHLEDKLLRISSTTEDGSSEKNTLSRTAKMVLSSRKDNLGANTTISSPKTEKLTKISPRSPAFVRKTPKLGHLTPQPMKKISPKSNKRSKSFGGLCKIPKYNETNELLVDKSLGLESRSPQDEKSNSKYTFKKTGSMSSTSTNNIKHCVKKGNAETVDNVHSEETEFSKSEVKKIKVLIQRFFNSFDVEQIDPDKITLRELRTTFEATNDVTLDKDGRQYFRNITSNYLELAMTMKQHKEKVAERIGEDQPTTSNCCDTPTRKRKSAGSTTATVHSPVICIEDTLPSSPAKIRRISNGASSSRQNSMMENDCEIVSIREREVQCPLCMRLFPQSIISDHAAVCGEEEVETYDLENQDNDLQITSVTQPTLRPVHQRETILDLSDNMRLTEEEKKHWINFSKKPKPYHPRMDKALFKGCRLVRCPSCSQYYKSNEIEEHSNECADKVNSGLEKRGLYYVKKTAVKSKR